MTTEHVVTWDDEQTVTTIEYGRGAPLVLLAHGAGTNQRHPMVSGIAGALARAGHAVMTFDYPYTEAGRRAPDRAQKLLACHRAVAEEARRISGAAPILAGRSMGGRMATMLAADGVDVAGLVCLAYPLHPAGKPDRLRIDHLASVQVPMLFFQGSRDSLSRSDLFDEHVRSLPNATVVDMEGADHSFRGRGWDDERIGATVVAGFEEWLCANL
jgi:predicted alpha/beta-hydrolase family hydrolase